MSDPADTDFDAMSRIIKAVSDLTDADKFRVLSMVWLAVAANVRNDALSRPGGFTEEQASQMRVLARMMALVKDAQPDMDARFFAN